MSIQPVLVLQGLDRGVGLLPGSRLGFTDAFAAPEHHGLTLAFGQRVFDDDGQIIWRQNSEVILPVQADATFGIPGPATLALPARPGLSPADGQVHLVAVETGRFSCSSSITPSR